MKLQAPTSIIDCMTYFVRIYCAEFDFDNFCFICIFYYSMYVFRSFIDTLYVFIIPNFAIVRKDLQERLSSSSLLLCAGYVLWFVNCVYYTATWQSQVNCTWSYSQVGCTKQRTKRYAYLLLGNGKACFVKEHTDSGIKYSESDIVIMLEFLVDKLFVKFWGMYFNRPSGYLWELIVCYSWPIYSYISMKPAFY